MEDIHWMTWGPWRRWYHPTLKERGFDGFNSGVSVHVVKLSHNILTHVTRIFPAPKYPTELRLVSFDGKLPSKILKLDWINNLYIFQNTIISGNVPSNTGNMTGLMDLYLSFTLLHGKTPSDLFLIRDLLYLDMDETHIHGPIPTDLDNMQQIKYLSIELSHPTTQFLWLPRYFPSGSRLYTYSTFDVKMFG